MKNEVPVESLFCSKTNVLYQLKQLERPLFKSNIRHLGMYVIMKTVTQLG